MQIILEEISSKIYTIRGVQVMLDRDLGELYGVETKRINEAVRNNPDKFPEDFYFELTNIEFDNLRSKFSTANISKIRTNPKAFTEQGIYMLATILKSKVASDVTISFNASATLLPNYREILESCQPLFKGIEFDLFKNAKYNIT